MSDNNKAIFVVKDMEDMIPNRQIFDAYNDVETGLERRVIPVSQSIDGGYGIEYETIGLSFKISPVASDMYNWGEDFFSADPSHYSGYLKFGEAVISDRYRHRLDTDIKPDSVYKNSLLYKEQI